MARIQPAGLKNTFSIPLDNGTPSSAALHGRQLVIVGDGCSYSLDVAGGELLWPYSPPGEREAVYDVCCTQYIAVFRSYDLGWGAHLARFVDMRSGEDLGCVEVSSSSKKMAGRMAIDRDILVVATDCGVANVFRLAALTAATLSDAPAPAQRLDDIDTRAREDTLVETDGRAVYLASATAPHVRCHALDGGVEWTADLSGCYGALTSLSTDRERLVVATDARMWCLSCQDGAVLWDHEAGNMRAALTTGPVSAFVAGARMMIRDPASGSPYYEIECAGEALLLAGADRYVVMVDEERNVEVVDVRYGHPPLAPPLLVTALLGDAGGAAGMYTGSAGIRPVELVVSPEGRWRWSGVRGNASSGGACELAGTPSTSEVLLKGAPAEVLLKVGGEGEDADAVRFVLKQAFPVSLRRWTLSDAADPDGATFALERAKPRPAAF